MTLNTLKILFKLLMREIVSPYNRFKKGGKKYTFIIRNAEINIQVEAKLLSSAVGGKNN